VPGWFRSPHGLGPEQGQYFVAATGVESPPWAMLVSNPASARPTRVAPIASSEDGRLPRWVTRVGSSNPLIVRRSSSNESEFVVGPAGPRWPHSCSGRWARCAPAAALRSESRTGRLTTGRLRRRGPMTQPVSGTFLISRRRLSLPNRRCKCQRLRNGPRKLWCGGWTHSMPAIWMVCSRASRTVSSSGRCG
jgi:hypothetical protein